MSDLSLASRKLFVTRRTKCPANLRFFAGHFRLSSDISNLRMTCEQRSIFSLPDILSGDLGAGKPGLSTSVENNCSSSGDIEILGSVKGVIPSRDTSSFFHPSPDIEGTICSTPDIQIHSAWHLALYTKYILRSEIHQLDTRHCHFQIDIQHCQLFELDTRQYDPLSWAQIALLVTLLSPGGGGFCTVIHKFLKLGTEKVFQHTLDKEWVASGPNY